MIQAGFKCIKRQFVLQTGRGERFPGREAPIASWKSASRKGGTAIVEERYKELNNV